MKIQPLDKEELEALEIYSEEVIRGIVHTEVWNQRMARLQQQLLNNLEQQHFHVVKTGEQNDDRRRNSSSA